MALAGAFELADIAWTLGDAGVDYYFSRDLPTVVTKHGLKYLERKAKQKAVEYLYDKTRGKTENQPQDQVNGSSMQQNPTTRSGAGNEAGSSGVNSTTDQRTSKRAKVEHSGFQAACGDDPSKNHGTITRNYSRTYRHYLTMTV